MIDLLVVLGLIAFGVYNAAIELYCLYTGQPTISNRAQRWTHRNVQIAALLILALGWLVAHFTGVPG